MKKMIVSILTATAMTLSQGVQADVQTTPPTETLAPPDTATQTPPVENKTPTNAPQPVEETASTAPRHVSKVDEREAAKARRSNWKNIGLAVAAVVVAIVALVAVSRNGGHRK